MIKFPSKSFDQVHSSDNDIDGNFENDDLVTFQHNSKTFR